MGLVSKNAYSTHKSVKLKKKKKNHVLHSPCNYVDVYVFFQMKSTIILIILITPKIYLLKNEIDKCEERDPTNAQKFKINLSCTLTFLWIEIRRNDQYHIEGLRFKKKKKNLNL